MNPIILYILIGIQLKQQIPRKLRINWELINLAAMVLQLRVLAQVGLASVLKTDVKKALNTSALSFSLCVR